ncbi:lytic murein transglycosylase [Halomonas sp. HP20-15]|uniref:lytic murein transglycosylase n=1 Tax=Halomonas sp. HP20-15 TaxID=3085901 RepID=UPI0029811D8E|nr:lytic murein transglycosylase [Halomonas sp. HP20-15]MDW5378739.1 lytic murein transglycosylase [Halomonas sp. HP20-15]
MIRRLPVSLLLTLLMPLAGCQVSASTTDIAGRDATLAPEAGQATGAADHEAGEPVARSVRQDFAAWVADFRRQALGEGINAVTLAAAFDDVRYLPRIIELDRAQPEFTRQVWDYLDTAVSAARVEQGRAQLAEHQASIQAASRRYGVPAEILVAIWGIESNYGSNFGNFSTIDALATLGYDGRRPDFARSELLAALRILQRGDIDREHMRGSWAGAMGHTQFLPSSFEDHARDADGDGRRDIWGSIADVMASTANYLADAGWRQGEPWGSEVRLPEGFDYAQTELDVRRSSQAWLEQGVRGVRGAQLPALDQASVIAPAGAHGPAFLVGHNFRVIMRYNASTSYALAVALLSERLAGEPGLVGDWPRQEPALSRSQVKRLQQLLNAHGFDVGAPDGVIGPNTRRGLREYQRSLGQTPDGFATVELLERLAAD